jgi:hypothetical protein
MATISNKKTGVEINVPLHIDGGCEVAGLVLLQEDIEALGLVADTDYGIRTAEQADGSVITLQEYERVLIELAPDTGPVWATSLVPAVIQNPHTEGSEAVTGVPIVGDVVHRLLGYEGLRRLGLKQDFVRQKLIKVLRRI